MGQSKKKTDVTVNFKEGILWIEEAGEFTHDMIEKLRVESGLPPIGSQEFKRLYYGNFYQPEETMSREMDLWNFTTIETPEPGECVWACNKGDKEAKRIKWGIGDEALYSYWMPCRAPVPPK